MMAVTVLWWEKIIQVPKADLTPTADPNIFDFDLTQFWRDLRALEWSVDGMAFQQIVANDPPRTYAGIVYPRGLNILTPWRVEFEDGSYAVNCLGSNNNLLDKRIWNSVSLQPNNAAARQASLADLDAVIDPDGKLKQKAVFVRPATAPDLLVEQ